MKVFWVACGPWFKKKYSEDFCEKSFQRLTEDLSGNHEHLMTQMPDLQAEPLDIVASQHIALVCKCHETACQFCDGGLFACVRCGSFEGATTTECPGEQIIRYKSDAVYEGRLDYVGGKWVWGACSPHSPQWCNSPGGKAEMQAYLASKGNPNAG